jgi:hypothetical protein
MVGIAVPTTRTEELVRSDRKFVRQVAAVPRAGRWRSVVGLIVFGTASIVAYGLFFGFIDSIFPRLTSGTIGGALAVLGLALTFSVIHGSFAGALLELLGIRELKKG